MGAVSFLALELQRSLAKYNMVEKLSKVRFNRFVNTLKFWLGNDYRIEKGKRWEKVRTYFDLYQDWTKYFWLKGSDWSVLIVPIYHKAPFSEVYALSRVRLLFQDAKSWNEVLSRVYRKRYEIINKDWEIIKKEAGKENVDEKTLQEIYDEYFKSFFEEYEWVKNKLQKINWIGDILVLEDDEEILNYNLLFYISLSV